MSKLALTAAVLSTAAIVVIVSSSLIAASHKAAHGTTTSIDPTQPGPRVGSLLEIQVGEPF